MFRHFNVALLKIPVMGLLLIILGYWYFNGRTSGSSVSFVSPTPAVAFSSADKQKVALFQKCGNPPEIDQYISAISNFAVTSELLWSPDCRFLAWSTYNRSPSVVAGDYGSKPSSPQGIFVFDIGATRVVQLYNPGPSADSYELQKWQDAQHLVVGKNSTSFDLDIGTTQLSSR
ncbi:MAG TPA: hypothetical protein VF828_00830 [Patescibacteria group bacterium]